MTTVMAPRGLRRLRTGALAALAVLIGTRAALALSLDERGEIRLGMRAYTAVRVGSERIGDDQNPLNWPVSGAGHLRQNRYFLQLSYDHDLTRLVKHSWGLIAPLRLLDPTSLKYTLEYRFEGEGLYDYGPDEYSHEYAEQVRFRVDLPKVNIPGVANTTPVLDPRYIQQRVDALRRNARERNRLFLAYLDLHRSRRGP